MKLPVRFTVLHIQKFGQNCSFSKTFQPLTIQKLTLKVPKKIPILTQDTFVDIFLPRALSQRNMILRILCEMAFRLSNFHLYRKQNFLSELGIIINVTIWVPSPVNYALKPKSMTLYKFQYQMSQPCVRIFIIK